MYLYRGKSSKSTFVMQIIFMGILPFVKILIIEWTANREHGFYYSRSILCFKNEQRYLTESNTK